MTDTKYTISHVSKTFPGEPPVRALDDIDLRIEQGEFVTFLGPSGCGKSTLLEIMAGLQQPTHGRVLLGSDPVLAPSSKVGIVFQDPSLYPWRTVLRNVELGLELRGVAREERRSVARDYLELVGLAGVEHKYPHQLSGGMRQRVGIARALTIGPDVLLMDEPFGAVDHLTRLGLQDDLLEIWSQRRRTVTFVTHDVAEAVYLADRVVLFSPSPGRIQHIWSVPVTRPRARDDLALIDLQNEIYAELNHSAARRDARLVEASEGSRV
ncbi:MAG TPA: ABC transporter ATP-binding protein [Actinopolymorphaceae bacterium]